MSNKILLIFEGNQAEAKIYKNIHKYFFDRKKDTVFYATYNTNIYSLYKEINNDPYLDIFELIKERKKEIQIRNLSKNYQDMKYHKFFYFLTMMVIVQMLKIKS